MAYFSVNLGAPGEIRLRDAETDNRVDISRVRGGLVKRMRVAGREVLYLDESTYQDRAKNVRGGIPLLFPSPGKLTDGRFRFRGREGELPQHGFLRQKEFQLVEFDAGTGVVILEHVFGASPAFPWSGRVEMHYVVSESVLRIEQVVTNRSDEPMPFATGFHPYFSVPLDKSKLRVDHHASQAFDNLTKRTVRAPKHVDFTAKEVDLHLLDHPSSSMALFEGDKLLVTVRASDDLGCWVLWTLADKPFVCVEPWSAPANALATGERLTVIEPGASRRVWMEIEAAV